MRVISGLNRGEKLFSPVLPSVRPTRNIVKAALFNMIRETIEDARFLDLFSGSGAVGIQALSEGAREVFFVEKNARSIELIQKNLKKLEFLDRSTIVKSKAEFFIKYHNMEIFDFIFMDPPYLYSIEQYCTLIEIILQKAKNGVRLFFEYTSAYNMNFLSSVSSLSFRENRYGNTKLGMITYIK